MSKFSAEHVSRLLRSDLDIYVEITQKRIEDYQGLAAKMEALYEFGSSLERSDPKVSLEITRLINTLLPQWKEMTLLAMYGKFEEALEVFESISGQINAACSKMPGEAPAALDFEETADEPDGDVCFKNGTGAAVPKPGEAAVDAPVLQWQRPSPNAAGLARRAVRPHLKVAGQTPRRNAREIAAAELENAGSGPGHGVLESATEDDMPGIQALPDPSAEPMDMEIAEVFKEEVAGYLNELSVILGNIGAHEKELPTWVTIRRLLHTIKGSAAMLGMDEVSAHALAAEKLARTAEYDPGQRTVSRAECITEIVLGIARLFNIPFGLVTNAA